MSEVPFHLTLMGRRFYEATMPALVEALQELNRTLEHMSTTGGQQRAEDSQPRADAPGDGPDEQLRSGQA